MSGILNSIGIVLLSISVLLLLVKVVRLEKSLYRLKIRIAQSNETKKPENLMDQSNND